MTLPELLQAIRARVGRWNTPGLWERADFIVGARDDLTKLLAIVELQRAALEHYESAHYDYNGHVCSHDDTASQALQACDKLAGGE